MSTPLADLVKVNLLASLSTGQACSNTFYIHKAGLGIPGLSELTSLATEIDTYFNATYRAMLTTADTYVAVRTYQAVDPTAKGPYLEAVLPKNSAGTVAFTRDCPESTCGIMAIQSSVAKRYARGRLFLPSNWQAADMNNGRKFNLTSTYYLNGVALAARFATGAGPSPTWTGAHLAGYTLCIFSGQQDKVVGPAITDASAVIMRPEVHWLRRRERGTS